MNRFKIQDPLEFLEDFKFHCLHAKKSVFIQTMNFDPGQYIDDLVEILINDSKRGAIVNINVDWLAERFFEGKYDIFYFGNSNVRRFNEIRQTMYRKLMESGVKLVVTNKPDLTTFFSHHTNEII